MTGAGFGGCAIALVHKTAVEDFVVRTGKEYTAKTGLVPAFFACEAGDGTHQV